MEGEPQGIEATKPVPVPLGEPVMPSPIRALCYTLASCGVGGLSYALLRDYEDWASPYWIGMTYAAAIVATLGLGLVAMVAWWRYGDAAQEHLGKPQGIEELGRCPFRRASPLCPPHQSFGLQPGACGLGALSYACFGTTVIGGHRSGLALPCTCDRASLGLALAAIVAWWRYGAAAQRASHWL